LLQAYINFQNEPVAARTFERRSQAHSFALYSGGSTLRYVFKANARSLSASSVSVRMKEFSSNCMDFRKISYWGLLPKICRPNSNVVKVGEKQHTVYSRI